MNSKSQDKIYIRKQMILIVIMFALILTAGFLFAAFPVKAQGDTTVSEEATPGDANPEKSDGLHYDEETSKWYLYKNGSKVMTSGWTTASKELMVNISKDGVVLEKLEQKGAIRKLYKCSGNTWIMQKNVWKTIKGNKYYFAASGICARIYINGRQLSIYSNGRMMPAQNTVYALDNKKLYLFRTNGIREARKGWYEVSANLTYYVSPSGYVTHRLLKTGNNYTYAHYDYTKNSWVNEKNCWKTFLGKTYYFGKSGICTRYYNAKSKRLYVYSGKRGKLIPAKNSIYRLQGSQYYFFNGSGTKVTNTGWKKMNTNQYVYVKSGNVTMRYKKSGNVRKLYQYNAKRNKWVAKKNTWQTIAGVTYRFNKNGTATIMYDTKTKKCYDFSKKKWHLVKNQTRKINGKNYFFDGKGNKVTSAGSYKTSDGHIAYVDRKGMVTKTELDLSVSRYYTINLGGGRTEKVYGHYDLASAEMIMREINNYRAERGESQLRTNASLTNIANIRAREISNSYGHTRPNGTLCINSIPELYGENIACGFENVDDVMWAWKRSQGHNENMLRSEYRYLGVSVFVAEGYDKEGFTYYFVQAFGR